MKASLLFVACILTFHLGFGQATATDFTQNDCNGISHNLFSELNANKVVVIAWVMPCEFCVDGAVAGWNAAQSFAVSNPGKVLYYLVDDFGDNTCADLSNWSVTNNVAGGTPITFNNLGKPINMNDYGSGGMPKVVVVGGSSHYVYFNENFSAADNEVAITSAIAQGLTGAAPTSVISLEDTGLQGVFLNGKELIVPQGKADQIKLVDISGRVLFNRAINNEQSIQVPEILNGMLLVQLFKGGQLVGVQKVISK